MQTLRDIAPYVALGQRVLSLVLLVLVVVLLDARRATCAAPRRVVLGHHEQRDIVAHVESLDSQVRNLREAVEILTDQLDDQKRHLDHALTNRAIIRYDAFRDAGGEQSASFALLDEYRSGVVFSAIAARDFARIYVKHLSDGVADRDLSPEEVQAVEAAVPEPLHERREGPAPARRRCPRAAAAGLRARGGRPAPSAAAPEARRAPRRPRRSRRSATPWPRGSADERRATRTTRAARARRRLHLGAAAGRPQGGALRPLTRPARATPARVLPPARLAQPSAARGTLASASARRGLIA